MNGQNIRFKITPKAARVNAQYTQKGAAELLNIDASTLRRYENSETVPPWDVVEKMESLYGITRDYLSFKSTIAFSDVGH